MRVELIIAIIWSVVLSLNVLNYFTDEKPSWTQVFCPLIAVSYYAWLTVFDLI